MRRRDDLERHTAAHHHLQNDQIKTLVHEARVRWLANHGWSELDCAGVKLIMGDAALVYQGEFFAGDLVVFKVEAAEKPRSGFRLFFRITRAGNAGPTPIALVENGMICFDYKSRRVAALPAAVAAVCRDAGPSN